jgi:hypothetical protein
VSPTASLSAPLSYVLKQALMPVRVSSYVLKQALTRVVAAGSMRLHRVRVEKERFELKAGAGALLQYSLVLKHLTLGTKISDEP